MVRGRGLSSTICQSRASLHRLFGRPALRMSRNTTTPTILQATHRVVVSTLRHAVHILVPEDLSSTVRGTRRERSGLSESFRDNRRRRDIGSNSGSACPPDHFGSLYPSILQRRVIDETGASVGVLLRMSAVARRGSGGASFRESGLRQQVDVLSARRRYQVQRDDRFQIGGEQQDRLR